MSEDQVQAQDAGALARDANKALRESQRAMFSGKLEGTQAGLETAAGLIAQIKAADPGFAQLKSLESKYERQRKDLERRLPKVQTKPDAAAQAETPSEADVSLHQVPIQDVGALASLASKALRESQRAMFSGKLKGAQADLKAAAGLIAQIKAADPSFAQLRSLESKYGRQVQDLEKRLPKAQAESGVVAPAETPVETALLPGGVTHRLKEIDRLLDRADRVLTGERASDDWKVSQLESVVNQAADAMGEILSRYGDQIPPDHPEMKAGQDRVTGLRDKLGEFRQAVANKQEKAAREWQEREAQSQEWLDRVSPYITGRGQPGYDEDRYLIPSGTEDVEELVRRKAIYDQAAALFAEYNAAAFPLGKADELERAERDLAYALDCFAPQYRSNVDGFFAKSREALAQAARWLVAEEAKDDGKRQPLLLPRDAVPNIRDLIATAAAATAEDAGIADLNRELAAIEHRARRLRELRAERTLLTADQFAGQELAEVKSKAAEFMSKEHPDAQALRTTVISGDWKEEKVLEHTDTTRTAVRYRVTRSVAAQVAGKLGDDVFLYTIHVAQDQQTGGAWGAYYGHVMFTDPMLEQNVNA